MGGHARTADSNARSAAGRQETIGYILEMLVDLMALSSKAGEPQLAADIAEVLERRMLRVAAQAGGSAGSGAEVSRA